MDRHVCLARAGAPDRRRRRHVRAASSMSRKSCRAGPAMRSISSSISRPMFSCRPMRWPRAACCRTPVAIPLSIAIVVSAAIYCADRKMKLPDNSFRGFPVLWNGIAFHLFVLKFSPWVTAAIVAAFVILTFAPYRTIHPLAHAADAIHQCCWRFLCGRRLLFMHCCAASIRDSGPRPRSTVAGVYLLGAGLTLSANQPER